MNPHSNMNVNRKMKVAAVPIKFVNLATTTVVALPHVAAREGIASRHNNEWSRVFVPTVAVAVNLARILAHRARGHHAMSTLRRIPREMLFFLWFDRMSWSLCGPAI